jgi:hypothetical protein
VSAADGHVPSDIDADADDLPDIRNDEAVDDPAVEPDGLTAPE